MSPRTASSSRSWPLAALVALACGPGPIVVDFGGDGIGEGQGSEDASTSEATSQQTTDTGEASGMDTTGTGTTSADTTSGETMSDADTTTTATSDADTSDADTSGTDTTGGETGGLPYDCDALVEPYVEFTELAGPRGYHDLVFDMAGRVIGWDAFDALLAATYAGAAMLYLPGVSGVEGMDVLDGGEIVFSTGSELRRISNALQVSVEASGFVGAYGVTVGPDQRVYVSASDAVYRVDLELGQSEHHLSLPADVTPRATVFDLDSTHMYIATLSWGVPPAPVYVVELDAALDPIGTPSVFASNVGQSWHDGIGIDACGNLYVPEFFSAGLYRIDPQGVVSVVYSGDSVGYGHGLEWGSGVGGWREDAIYLPQPYDTNTVRELVLGVPSGASVRTWAGG